MEVPFDCTKGQAIIDGRRQIANRDELKGKKKQGGINGYESGGRLDKELQGSFK